MVRQVRVVRTGKHHTHDDSTDIHDIPDGEGWFDQDLYDQEKEAERQERRAAAFQEAAGQSVSSKGGNDVIPEEIFAEMIAEGAFDVDPDHEGGVTQIVDPTEMYFLGDPTGIPVEDNYNASDLAGDEDELSGEGEQADCTQQVNSLVQQFELGILDACVVVHGEDVELVAEYDPFHLRDEDIDQELIEDHGCPRIAAA